MDTPNVDTLQPDIAELAKDYAGRWVALDPADGRVVASADTAKSALVAAESQGIELPVVIHVERDYGQLAP